RVRAAVEPYRDTLSVAALNGPENIVVSGDGERLQALLDQLKAEGVKSKKLVVSHAFHSPLMDPILDEFERVAREVSYGAPRMRLISNRSGRPAGAEVASPSYWREHLRESVQFTASVEWMHSQGVALYLEIGPGTTLLGMGQRIVEGAENPGLWLPTLRPGKDDWGQVLDSLGRLYAGGVAVNWTGFDAGYARRKVALPTYPFQRDRYWMPQPKAARTQPAQPLVHPLLGYRLRSALKVTQFEMTFGAETFSFLNDHRIYGAALLPATGYVELATAAAQQLYGTAYVQDLTIHDALIVADDETRTAQLIITPQDASRASFEYFTQGADEDGWKLHASGSLVSGQVAPSAQVDLAVVRARCAETVSGEAHYQHLFDNGLTFGESLHGIQSIWRRDGEVLAEIRLPERAAAEFGAYQFHPALLDACLQALAWAQPRTNDVYLPLSIEAFHMFRQPATQVYSHVQIQPQSDGRREIVRGDVRVLDVEGAVIAEVRGLALKRAGADLLRQFAGAKYEEWLYQVVWQPQVAAGEGLLPPPAELAARAEPRLSTLAAQYDLSRFLDGLLPELETLSIAYVWSALQQLGWRPRAGERFATDTLAKRLQIFPAQRRLFARLLEMLAEVDVLTHAGSEWQVRALPSFPDPGLLHAALLEEYPAYHAELTITGWCGGDLARALVGQVDPVQLLFPDGGAMAEKMYRDSPAAHVYSGLVGETVKTAVANLPADRPLRVLEIGGGTGGTSAHVLPHLPADRTEYTFTDIGALFVAKAQEKFSTYPFMRFQTLNIEEDPAGQGLAGAQFDLIIAANVIHATANLHSTLAHVRGLLAPGGTFMMLEVTQRRRWVDITFGLTDGWWRFVDSDIRPDYPLLSRAAWLDLLANSGFAETTAMPGEGAPFGEQAVIVARGPSASAAAADAGSWLIFADEGGLGADLALALRQGGGRAALVWPGDEEQAFDGDRWRINPGQSEQFKSVMSQIGDLRGVVYLWGLDARLPDAALTEHLGSLESYVTGGALNLVKALASLAAPPRLWLVTRGGAGVQSGAGLAVAQSPLWGLGKTIALEHPELHPTRLDLDPVARDDVQSLLNELRADSPEDQIAFRLGERHVSRLRYSHEAPQTTVSDAPWRLEIAQKGVLDNLRVAPLERRTPGAGEVEVRVLATGLNFKDVLNALGMYPGDAGPLGGECAGIVTAVGAGVEHLRVGDRVLALASGCFASHVTAPAALTMPLVPGLTMDEAAGFAIPFVTAYYALHYIGRMQAGERVLIHAAAGGVGLAAVQLARQAGVEVFATAGSEAKRAFLHGLGVEHVMDSRSLAFADQIMQITEGRGVDLVLNSLAGDFIPASLGVLADGARFLEIGKSGLLTEQEAAALGRGIQYHIIDWTGDARENPQLIGGMLRELMDNLEHGRLNPLPHQVFPASQVSDAFRYMAQARHIGKIIVTQPRDAWDGTVYPDATYLITGGLRGLGLLVAQWLVERGARHLALVGRSVPSESAIETLRELENQGAEIGIFQGDVGQHADVTRVLSTITAHMPPLRGVIHSAGVLDDGLLLHQDWERFAYVMGPKVNGAWYLHAETLGQPLDFFVMFSSVASLLGSSGQGNHAAANAFMDALAYHRQASGLPALSINWGAWSEIGAAAERNVAGRASEQGMGTISPADGLTILDRLMRGDAPQIGVTPMDWPKFLRAFGDDTPPFLRAMVKQKAASSAAAPTVAEAAPAKPVILTQLA
ncbi:MAG: SDR family NAD(P)-dependent oxidoreductase, partial [Anaerolineae bacterium]|nr:SDR family NAD(P)-dependent oxidoreductase [Anaerolineae bacterium]